MNEELVIAAESTTLRTAAFAAEAEAAAVETELLAARAAAQTSLKAGVVCDSCTFLCFLAALTKHLVGRSDRSWDYTCKMLPLSHIS